MALSIRPMQWANLPELHQTAALDDSDLDCLEEIRGVLSRHGTRAQTLELDDQESTAPPVLTFKLRDLKEIMQWDQEPYVTVGLGENTLVLQHGDLEKCVATSIFAGKARN